MSTTLSQTVTIPPSQPNTMSERKKHKSEDGKKRKREHKEDGHTSKSKKHKADKSTQDLSSVESNSSDSPFHLQTSSLYLPLSPIAQKYPLEGVCAEHLSPLILTYYPPLKGVILSYSNPRLSEAPFGRQGENILLKSIDEYAVSWGWVTAEYLLFKPEAGVTLEGYVNLQNEGHLGVVCWNMFNASIERKRLPQDWKWVGTQEQAEGEEIYAEEGVGYYVDGDGNKIPETIKFKVREIESSHDRERGFLSIEGTMLEEEEEKRLQEEEKGNATGRDTAGRRLGGSKAVGATSLATVTEPDPVVISKNGESRRHRRNY
ncbi:hypothetical protein F5884DRAFT_790906 [Xylogone sp. PMI_703]|nr:hypothetical protein F5884DRAFT_790906 [Xylogone sp. PMI_703]